MLDTSVQFTEETPKMGHIFVRTLSGSIDESDMQEFRFSFCVPCAIFWMNREQFKDPECTGLIYRNRGNPQTARARLIVPNKLLYNVEEAFSKSACYRLLVRK